MSETTAVCGFCGQRSGQTIEGPSGVYACKECLIRAKDVIDKTQQGLYHCNFCGDSVTIDAVVAGPNGLHMCLGCVESGIKLLSK